MEPQERQQLLDFKKIALDKRTEGKFLKEKEIALLLVRVLPTTNSLTLPESLKQDLRGMGMYDAIANWCDPDTGLAKSFPHQIISIASQLLPLEKK